MRAMWWQMWEPRQDVVPLTSLLLYCCAGNGSFQNKYYENVFIRVNFISPYYSN